MSDIKKEEEIAPLATIKMESDECNWDKLTEENNFIVKEIIDLQMLVVTMVKANEKAIDANSDLYATVTGLMKTIDDAALETKKLSDTHAGLTGLISQDDDDNVLKFLNTLNEYNNIGEKVSMLTSTAITDILTMINFSNDDVLKTSINVQTEIAEKIQNK